MAILTTAGRASYQESMAARDIHMGWGTGDVSWGGSPPAESTVATGLLAEIGRLEATQVSYVTPDAGGSIVVPGGTYEISVTPTRHLFLDFHFGITDADDQTIREIGVFIGTTREVGVPGGQAYLIPAEVDSPGTLLLLEHLNPAIVRSDSVRERFRYVITL